MKTKKFFIVFMTISVFALLAFKSPETDYDKLWASFAQKMGQSLFRTAEAELDSIEALALSENNQLQLLKTILYRQETMKKPENEIPDQAFIQYAESKIDLFDSVTAAILHEEIADVYQTYYQSNSWKIRNNVAIDDDLGDVSMKYWGERNFRERIDWHYSEALNLSDALKSSTITTKYCLQFFQSSNVINQYVEYEPTLFEFIFHRAANYYQNASSADDLDKTWNTSLWWMPANEFVETQLPESDSPMIRCLSIYQELIRYNLQNTDDNILIYNDYKRYQYINGLLGDDKKYQEALLQMINQHGDNPLSSEIATELANSLVSQYERHSDDSLYFNNLLEAKELCHKTIAKFPHAENVEKTMKLIDHIVEPDYKLLLNDVQLPNENIPVALNYRNVNRLYYKIFKVNEEVLSDLDRTRNNTKYLKMLMQQPVVVENKVILPKETDYRWHSTLLALPPLETGLYIILTNLENNTIDIDKVVTCQFQVSGLSYLTSADDGKITLRTLDRKTGKPIENVEVSIYSLSYSYRKHKYTKSVEKKLKSDADGKVKFKAKGYNQHVLLQKDDQILYSEDYLRQSVSHHGYFYYNTTILNTKIFTDRAIYRPGQTVYFQGIVIENKGDIEKLAKGIREEIIFKDANREEIARSKFKTDDYGTFSGSFVIPSDSKSGEYCLRNRYGRYVSFRVEEYKRPTFEIKFEQPKEQYKLNQDITVRGSVNAFAGFGLDNVDYSYRVVRKTGFPWHCKGVNYPKINDEQLAFGKSKTNGNGGFEITFNLKPSRDVAPEYQPVFTYEIELTATDAQGETHSETFRINAAYNEIAISSNLTETIDAANLDDYFIEIVNMNGNPAKTYASCKVYRYDEAERINYFEAMGQDYIRLDRKLLSDEDLEKAFPKYDFYPKDTKTLISENGLVIDGKIGFQQCVNHLENGKYLIEIRSYEDSLAVLSQDFMLIGNSEPKMPCTAIEWHYVDKNEAQPGDTIHFSIGSSADDVEIFVRLVHGDEVRLEKQVRVDNGIEVIPYLVNENDRGVLELFTAFVKENSHQVHCEKTAVPFNNYNLNVNLSTMRDNLEPGTNETWEISVTDYQGKPYEGALLASMYDASLNTFCDHQWSFNMKPSFWHGTNYMFDNVYFMNKSTPGYHSYNYRVTLFNFTLPSDAPFFDAVWIRRYTSAPRYVPMDLSPGKPRGRLKGKITDETGEPVPFANIIVEKGEWQMGGASSDFDGYYDINPIPPGTYTLKANCIGLNPFVLKGLVIPANKITYYDVKMKNGAICLNEVTVIDYEIPLISKDNTTSGASITSEEIAKLPNRSCEGVASSVGGVFSSNGEVGNIRGARESAVYYVDGVKVLEDIEHDNYDFPEILPFVSPRENFNETAFFLPNLRTDENGKASISFTMPDAITRWKLMLLAYGKDRKTGYNEYSFSTSKPVMIMADMPRYMYDNDTLVFVANVINTGNVAVKPKAQLEIYNAATMEPVNLLVSNQIIALQEIVPGRSQKVEWKVAAQPDLDLLAFRFTAFAGDFSDAEQHLLPVLNSEIFMTQTLPLTVAAETEKTFSLDSLSNPNGHEKDYAYTLNFSSNPIWYAVQPLPHLNGISMYCPENAFYVFYANTLSSYIADNVPHLMSYIHKWKVETPDALLSQLEKDEDLKAIMLKETPWVFEAKNVQEQRSRLAILFDDIRLPFQQTKALNLMERKQKPIGGWSWMDDMPESPFITSSILAGFGRLYKMGALGNLNWANSLKVSSIENNAVTFLENDIAEQYRDARKKPLNHQISQLKMNELYALSFFEQQDSDKDFAAAQKYYLDCIEKNWTDLNYNMRAKAALVLYRRGRQNTAKLIMQSFKECALKDENIGMYWPKTYFAFESYVGTHANIMAAFAEIENDNELLDQMRIWLLSQKKGNLWENSASTLDATYALLLMGNDWLKDDKEVTLKLGNQQIDMDGAVAGTGFIQRRWNVNEITEDMRHLTVDNPTKHLVWGGLFRQYFVPIDEVKSDESAFKISRELFVEKTDENGKILVPIEKQALKVGDKLTVKITFESKQDMEYVFVKDLRAAGFEPIEQISHYEHNDQMSYYQTNTDTDMEFFIEFLPKGTHQVEYSMFVTKEGNLSNGYALIQCLYAPEFSAYSNGIRVKVE